jgi:ElaB/YqjD/DUF883 family membrane-anchored ribosome-binding protein
MNSETATPFPTSTSASTGGSNAGATDANKVKLMAQRAHETVDKLEQSVNTGSERLMEWHQEYGDLAREQVRASPIAAVGVSFLVGIVFAKLFLR